MQSWKLIHFCSYFFLQLWKLILVKSGAQISHIEVASLCVWNITLFTVLPLPGQHWECFVGHPLRGIRPTSVLNRLFKKLTDILLFLKIQQLSLTQEMKHWIRQLERKWTFCVLKTVIQHQQQTGHCKWKVVFLTGYQKAIPTMWLLLQNLIVLGCICVPLKTT